MTLPGWTREPLVHFLFAGALLYAFFAWSGGDGIDPASRVIDVDETVQAQLAVRFERTIGRAPTDAELDAQIEQYVRDEVLYREALRLGLDQGDAVVRQRMVSKMDMSASAAAEIAEPSEDQLRAFFDKNQERYQSGATFNFDQAYFSSEAAARSALTLPSGDVRGEPISLPESMIQASSTEIAARFGESFARNLGGLPVKDDWQGPVQSGFGWHLVKVQSREADRADFAQLRPRIENDWRSAQIAERRERAFEILRDAYRVTIER